MFKYALGFEFTNRGDIGRVAERHETLHGPRYRIEWNDGDDSGVYDEPGLDSLTNEVSREQR